MKTHIRIGLCLTLLLSMSTLQAQNNNSTNDRFPFEYNQRSKTPEVSLIWDNVYIELYDNFINKDKLIILHCFSSATGKKKYNYKLSKDRGNAVKDFLIMKGVKSSRILIEPHGEPNVENYGDDDYAGDRNVLPEFKRIDTKISKDYADKYMNKKSLDDDIKKGQNIFLNIIKPYVTYIKKEYHLQKLPGPGRPSKDVDKFLKQTKEVFDDAKSIYGDAVSDDYESFIEVVGKYGVASFIDLFTSLQAGKIAKKRKLLYDVMGEAFAVECFPQYYTSTANYSVGQKFLFYSVKYEVSQLSDFEKYKLRVRFIYGATHTTSTFSRRKYFERDIERHDIFLANIRHYFSKSDTRYKD